VGKARQRDTHDIAHSTDNLWELPFKIGVNVRLLLPTGFNDAWKSQDHGPVGQIRPVGQVVDSVQNYRSSASEENLLGVCAELAR
jgi:hypothetical protein